MKINTALSELQTLLYGYNYEVFLQSYQLPLIPGATVKDYIIQAFPNAEVGRIWQISEQDVFMEVEQSLTYSGDDSSGPNPMALKSPRFSELLGITVLHLEKIVKNATAISGFWLKDGHPAYPVFWDFAFVVIGTQNVELFIGSRSD
jgi:hypothetical protein